MKICRDYQDVLDGYSFDAETDTFKQLSSHNKDKGIRTAPNLPQDILIAEEVADGEANTYFEGAVKKISVNAYERDLRARQACINYYKCQNGNRVVCWVCGFAFGEFYSEKLVDKIHVHHKVPLCKIKGKYEVEPIEDLIPICPNCHYAVHVLDCTVEELKSEVEKRRLSTLA